MKSKTKTRDARPKTPDQILHELAIERPDEIDIEVIAQYLGATIYYKPLKGCEARIVGYGDRAIIAVNSTSSWARQRFSAGHELGHWVHDRGRVSFTCDSAQINREWSANNAETRANRFASDLLLPLNLFVPLAQRRPPTLETTRSLSTSFETSLTATAIRLVEHGSYPCMIVCHSPDRRVWFSRGADVPKAIWPRDGPGKGTLAYELLHNDQPMVNAEAIDTYADEWLTTEGSDGYSIHEESILIADGLTLSLLWWKDEQQLIDLEDEMERRSSRRSDGRED